MGGTLGILSGLWGRKKAPWTVRSRAREWGDDAAYAGVASVTGWLLVVRGRWHLSAPVRAGREVAMQWKAGFGSR